MPESLAGPYHRETELFLKKAEFEPQGREFFAKGDKTPGLRMTRYRFDDFFFDDRNMTLRKGEEKIEAQPRVLGLLAYLLQHRERLVGKNELVEALWDGRMVSDDAVNKRIALLRKALDDVGRQGRYLRTVYGKGVNFAGEVEVEVEGEAAAAAPSEDARMASEGSPPMIAVLPFRITSTASRFAAMAEAIPDDITSSLVRFRSLPVIARASAFRFAHEANPIAALREELDIDFVLTGRIELTGEALTVYAELVRTGDESLVWSDSFRGSVEEVHTIRDEIVGRIVNATDTAVPREQAARARLKMPSDLDAWEAYHLGQSLSVEAVTPDYPRAQVYFRKAVDLVGDFTRARASLAYVHWNFFTSHQSADKNRLAMLAESEKAIELDPFDPVAQMTYGAMQGSVGDIATATTHVARCLELAPNYARGHASMAGVLAAQGRIPDSLDSIGRAIALSPRDPHLPTWLAIRLVGNSVMGKMDEVKATSDTLAALATNQIVPLGWAMTGYSLSGDGDAAKATADRIRAMLPQVPARKVPGVYDGLPPALRAMLEKSFRDHALVE